MKPKDKLKKKLHELIDYIEDESVLKTLNEQIAPYITKSSAKNTFDDLTEEQQKKLKNAIAEADKGKTISQKEFRKALGNWLSQ